MEDFRKELDELLGKDRNLPRSERMKKKEHFDDNDVCKYYLVAFCPHELFINTRNDIGRCKKRHDTFFKQQYQTDPNRLYYQKKYELSLLALLEQLVSTVDARIRRSLARIEAPMPDIETTMENRDKKNALNALIDRRMKEAEQLAEAGRVNESEQLIKEIEQLKEQKDDQDNMICEICGAMQSATDTERRTVSHLDGKQHKGFTAIRKCIEDLKSHKDMYRHVDVSKPLGKGDEKKEEEKKEGRERQEVRERGYDRNERNDRNDRQYERNDRNERQYERTDRYDNSRRNGDNRKKRSRSPYRSRYH